MNGPTRKNVLVALGIGACAICCLAPALVLAILGGGAAAMLGAPLVVVGLALTAMIAVLYFRQRSASAHACADGACTCA
jgi:hypothetical protein